jgi:hypothetical protein
MNYAKLPVPEENIPGSVKSRLQGNPPLLSDS